MRELPIRNPALFPFGSNFSCCWHEYTIDSSCKADNFRPSITSCGSSRLYHTSGGVTLAIELEKQNMKRGVVIQLKSTSHPKHFPSSCRLQLISCALKWKEIKQKWQIFSKMH